MLSEASLSSSVEHHRTDRNSFKVGSPTEERKQMWRASTNSDNTTQTLISIWITFEMRPDWWRARTPNKLPNKAFRSSFWKTREDSETSKESNHKGFEADRRKRKHRSPFSLSVNCAFLWFCWAHSPKIRLQRHLRPDEQNVISTDTQNSKVIQESCFHWVKLLHLTEGCVDSALCWNQY